MSKRLLWKDEEYNVESPGKRIRREDASVLSTTTTIDIDKFRVRGNRKNTGTVYLLSSLSCFYIGK